MILFPALAAPGTRLMPFKNRRRCRVPARGARARLLVHRANTSCIPIRSVVPLLPSASIAMNGDRGIKVVPAHPLVKHWLSILRESDTPTSAFKNAMAELGRILTYEATKDWLTTVTKVVQSPLASAFVESIDETQPILIVPILRAGLAIAEHATSLLPYTTTFHLGMARDEKTLQPSVYLNKLPDRLPEGCRILVMDPMLATGGTMIAALNLLKDRGAKVNQIRVISAVTCPYGLEKLGRKFPGIQVYVAAVDHVLNEKGYMIPGLGDAGDRCYGTEPVGVGARGWLVKRN